GNVSFNTLPASALVLNNSGGQVVANAGTINFRTPQFSLKSATTVNSGLMSAQAVNVFGGNGTVNVTCDQINGVVNVNGGKALVTASSGTLNIGTMNLSGDPTIVNTDGSVNLTGNLTIAGGDLAILAKDNITASASVNSISTNGGTGRGGDIYIAAG